MTLRRLGPVPAPPNRGSSVVEVVILAPALGLFLALIIAGGRVAAAHQAVEASAAEAARAASHRPHPGTGRHRRPDRRHRQPAQPGHHLRSARPCRVDTSGFATPVGNPASVGATVTCQVDLADGLLPGLPGSMAISATVRSPLDTYRER